uniref:G_PROTEIN_RECEP_F1_2 domain-containing protein n=1 Tax=Rhabditophanes sp. KR3021 TaxID=114890 RepID=A0AC35U5W0_9BILA
MSQHIEASLGGNTLKNALLSIDQNTTPPTTSLSILDNINCHHYSEQHPDMTNIPPIMIVFLVFYVHIFLFGIIGNATIAYMTLKHKVLQSVQNIFILNLVISDIIVCIFSLPLTPITNIVKQWHFGTPMCHLLPMIQAVSVYVSSFSLSAIAIDRYILVVRPHSRPISVQGARYIATILWTVSIFVSLPYAYFMKIERYAGVCGEFCNEGWGSIEIKATYSVIVLTAQFIIPFATMAFCYTCIFTKLRARTNVKLRKLTERSLLLEQVSQKTTTISTVVMDPASSSTETNNTLKIDNNGSINVLKESDSRQIIQVIQQQRRTTSILATMVLIFVITLLPQNVYTLLLDYDESFFYSKEHTVNHSYLVALIAHSIAMLMNVANPILYAWLNPNFKNIFIASLKRNNRNNRKFKNNNNSTPQNCTVKIDNLATDGCQV